VIFGGAGNDILNGNAGPNSLSGSSGDDILSALQGNDLASGRSGSDTINGSQGSDTIIGEGAHRPRFRTRPGDRRFFGPLAQLRAGEPRVATWGRAAERS
jgi:Ca2+-binding RTX toxin-like protein